MCGLPWQELGLVLRSFKVLLWTLLDFLHTAWNPIRWQAVFVRLMWLRMNRVGFESAKWMVTVTRSSSGVMKSSLIVVMTILALCPTRVRGLASCGLLRRSKGSLVVGCIPRCGLAVLLSAGVMSRLMSGFLNC